MPCTGQNDDDESPVAKCPGRPTGRTLVGPDRCVTYFLLNKVLTTVADVSGIISHLHVILSQFLLRFVLFLSDTQGLPKASPCPATSRRSLKPGLLSYPPLKLPSGIARGLWDAL